MPIGAVGADVAYVPEFLIWLRIIDIRVGRTVERPSHSRAETRRQLFEKRSTSKGKIKVKTWYQIRREIFMVTLCQLRHRHRRIYVVEGDRALRMASDPLSNGHSLGNVRSENNQISRSDVGMETVFQ